MQHDEKGISDGSPQQQLQRAEGAVLGQFVWAFNRVSEKLAADSAAKGFGDHFDNELYVPTKLGLVVTEIAEGIEAHRADVMSDHLSGTPGLHEEMADAVIRLMTLGAELGIDLGQTIINKMQFNQSRPHRHGGKKY
jgi:NTP pyrophosphatase (non-canonical NTP hydrolase)